MKAVFRQMKFGDLKNVRALNELTLPENYPLAYWEMIFNQGAKKHSFVSVVSGDIVGYVFCDGKSIISFSVHEKYRRKGIAKQLMMYCLTTCVGKELMLHVRLGNENAIKLYEFFGFKKDKIVPDYYTNLKEDAHEMILHVQERETIKYVLKKKINI
jgi:ribosomal-protein-alanine N-acetyltransferase